MAPTAAPTGLSVRIRADKSGGDGTRAADLPGAPPGTWPFAGVEFVDTFQKVVPPPDAARVSTGWVQQAISSGWVEAEGHEVHTRPAGPAHDPWAKPAAGPDVHVFHHYTALVFHTMDGDVRYRVTHQPDKYADYAAATYPDQVAEFDADDTTPVDDERYAAGATRVDWFYDLEREG